MESTTTGAVSGGRRRRGIASGQKSHRRRGDSRVAIPEQVMTTLRDIGQVATEVPGSHDDVRAFVTVYRFGNPWPGGAERYAYLGPRQILYRARRFQISREV